MENTHQEPKKGGFNWGHGLLVALGAFMVFIVSLIVYFTQTMQNSELITDNYYQEELAYQQVIDAKNRANLLAEKPSAEMQKEGIKITFPKEISEQSKDYHFFLFRTDDKNLDIKKDFSLDENNTHLIPANILKTGGYTLKLMWNNGGETYQIDYDILWTQP